MFMSHFIKIFDVVIEAFGVMTFEVPPMELQAPVV